MTDVKFGDDKAKRFQVKNGGTFKMIGPDGKLMGTITGEMRGDDFKITRFVGIGPIIKTTFMMRPKAQRR